MPSSEERQRSLAVPADEGLYQFRNEHDACGVGMVANLDGHADHGIGFRLKNSGSGCK